MKILQIRSRPPGQVWRTFTGQHKRTYAAIAHGWFLPATFQNRSCWSGILHEHYIQQAGSSDGMMRYYASVSQPLIWNTPSLAEKLSKPLIYWHTLVMLLSISWEGQIHGCSFQKISDQVGYGKRRFYSPKQPEILITNFPQLLARFPRYCNKLRPNWPHSYFTRHKYCERAIQVLQEFCWKTL